METKDLSVTIIGCGWLGLKLGKELVEKGYSVNGSVRKPAGFGALESVGINPFELDLEKSTDVPTSISMSERILVISIPPIDRKKPLRYETMLQELLNQFSDETKVIFTSSTGIYPKNAANYTEDFSFSNEQESTILNIAENVVRNSNKSSVIFRLGGLVGPDRHPIRFLQGRKGVKNPHGPINFVHQEDCVRALLQAIENKEFSGTFNLVFPNHPTRKNYYTEAAKFYKVAAPIFNEENEVERLISSEKINRDVNFEFKFPIDSFPELELN
ncbi:MAG: hypothetical protein HRT58_18515 [Crocinitomicaceae bacterium]|nr:hypothetical protein [Flavobacteriales bacterium]NQZ37664.1 hypothetical protein [Crocinitomicaceae bacterium]